jgi:hypothetical protein
VCLFVNVTRKAWGLLRKPAVGNEEARNEGLCKIVNSVPDRSLSRHPLPTEGKRAFLFGYSDADFAGHVDQRKSTSGYLFVLGGGPVSWKSQRQRTVTLSTTEAEYVALTEAIREANSIRQLLVELGSVSVATDSDPRRQHQGSTSLHYTEATA